MAMSAEPRRRLAGGIATAAARDAAGLLAGAFLISWLAALAWWWLLPTSRAVELTISAGTAALVRAGELPPNLPRELVLRVGDTIAVRNLDSVAHRVGPLSVAPGGLERSAVGPAFFAGAGLICTIHPAGALSVLPRSRPGPAVTIPVALVAAIPLAFGALVAISIAGRLDGARDAETGLAPDSSASGG